MKEMKQYRHIQGEGAIMKNGIMPKTWMNKLDMHGSLLDDVILRRSVISYVDFTYCDLSDVDFSHASFGDFFLNDAIFLSARMHDSRILKSDLTNLSIENCTITGMTIDGYNIEELIKKAKAEAAACKENGNG